jgi:hypothetical protein
MAIIQIKHTALALGMATLAWVGLMPRTQAEPPAFGFDTSATQEDSTLEVKPLPRGWNECFIHRTKVAYVEALPAYQRFFLSPYRSLEKSRYVRCSKSHITETREFMEASYPLPYDPASQLKPEAQRLPQPTPATPQ